MASQPRWQKENLVKNLALVEEVKGIAAEKGVTPGQLALAWVLHQGDDVFPIPGVLLNNVCSTCALAESGCCQVQSHTLSSLLAFVHTRLRWVWESPCTPACHAAMHCTAHAQSWSSSALIELMRLIQL